MAELTLKERLRKAALTVDEPGKRSTFVQRAAPARCGAGRCRRRRSIIC